MIADEQQEILNAITEVYMKFEEIRENDPSNIRDQLGLEEDLKVLRIRLEAISYVPRSS